VKSRYFNSYDGSRKESALMSDTIDVHLTLTRDKPNSMDFRDTYSGLEDIWYKIDADATQMALNILQGIS
jgi:hypothetical protein